MKVGSLNGLSMFIATSLLMISLGIVSSIGCAQSPAITDETPTVTHEPTAVTNATPGSTTPVQITTEPASTNQATETPLTSNTIIDHSNWDWYNSQPQSVFELVSGQRIYFAHASVGANVLQGMLKLNTDDPLKYPLAQIAVNDTPPATISKGNMYQFDRGNPGWLKKVTGFEAYIENGWHDAKVDMVMNKFCYIDQKAELTTYLKSMTTLEAKYPGTKYIYWTMPLMTSTNTDEILRSEFNQGLREWIKGQGNKILFDIADIEAWDPAGQQQTFTSKGKVYERMYAGYSTDGGHLNETGMLRMATGLYSLFGKIVNTD